ncbi:hypothetical protein BC830DRAFT_1258619 [Chytriomyces sp. MP71]|nr:hypothetical protein BC830DRAFT_1258619 [Chytriomyces sp. MP71]
MPFPPTRRLQLSVRLATQTPTKPFRTNVSESQIGFAKFRSRSEANYACDFLNGRRIDSRADHCDCILKAEIAKKNLHASYTTPTSNGLSRNASPLLMQSVSPAASVASPSSTAAAAAEASSLGGSAEFGDTLQSPVRWDLFIGDEAEEKDVRTRLKSLTALSGGGDFGGRASVSRPRINTNEATLDAASRGSGNSSRSATPCPNSPTTRDGDGEEDEVVAVVQVLETSSRMRNVCSTLDDVQKEWAEMRSGVTATAFGRMMGNIGVSAAAGQVRTGERGFSSALFSSDSLWNVEAASGRNVASLSMNVGGFGAGISAGGLGGLSSAGGYGRVPAAPSTGAMYSSAAVGAGNGGGLGVLYSPYLPLGNGMHPALVANGGAFQVNLPTPASIAAAGYRCPADQNPPCNTLYVGNLPSNTSEVELRDVFARCLGYRRMSFRMRPNGPMVFVEFESIPCAQQALNDLHGTLLSNSIRGGLRLSFSKNPLGVRLNHSTSHPHLNLGHVGGMGGGGWNGRWNTLPSPSLLTPISGLFEEGELVR